MSNSVDEVKNKVLNGTKKTAAEALLGGVNPTETEAGKETAVTDESNKKDAVSKAFSGGDPKPEKKLKGIYIDEDVLKVYEEQAKLKERGRGWGSQLVSDLLREAFEQQGLMPNRK